MYAHRTNGVINPKENTPIIVANTHWDLPENLIRYVQEERMTTALIDMATPLSPEESIGYAECVAYLMPATQQAVLRSDVAEIYLYCVTQLMKNRKMSDALKDQAERDKYIRCGFCDLCQDILNILKGAKR